MEEDIFGEAQKLADMFSSQESNAVTESATETGILVDIDDQNGKKIEDHHQSPKIQKRKRSSEKSEIEQCRMDLDNADAAADLPSPTLPELSGDSDDLLTNQKFDFDFPISPTNAGNTTFTKDEPEVMKDDDDEVFFGPVRFTEVVVKKAVEEEIEQTKPLSNLTDAEMMEVMAESMRLADIIQNTALPLSSTPTRQRSQEDTVPLSSTPTKPLSTEQMVINSRTVTKSPIHNITLSEKDIQGLQVKLFSPKSDISEPSKREECSEADTVKAKNQQQKRSGLKPPSAASKLKPPSIKSQIQIPKTRYAKQSSEGSNKSMDEPTTLNSSVASDITDDVPPPEKKRSLGPPLVGRRSLNASAKRSSEGSNKSMDEPTTLNSSVASDITDDVPPPEKKRSLRPPQVGRRSLNVSSDDMHTSLNSSMTSAGSDVTDESTSSNRKRSLRPPSRIGKLNKSSEDLHSSLNSSIASDISEHSAPPEKKACLRPPSQLNRLPTGVPILGSNSSKVPLSGQVPESKVPLAGQRPESKMPLVGKKSGLIPPTALNKPAIKSTLTKLDKLKPSLGAGVTRLVRPGTSNLGLRPSGPMKAVQPASVQGQAAQSRLTTPATASTPSKSTEIQRRRSMASPSSGGSSTPKRTGVTRSSSFSAGQRTPTESGSTSSTGTPGSGKRRSFLPTISQRDRASSQSSSLGSVSSVPESPSVLSDINNISDASPSCFKSKVSRLQYTPVNKETTSKLSRWSPLPRRKPISGDEYFVCTKKVTN